MLSKLGWQSGQSIGNSDRNGLVEPLQPFLNRKKGRGLRETNTLLTNEFKLENNNHNNITSAVTK